MKIISVVGARPEFVQAAPLSRALRMHHCEIIVHTGQHYDYRMSQAFFDDLGTPAPDYNLEVGSGTHATQTAAILVKMEEVLHREQPDLVIIRGDTNSTMASALAAAKLHVPIAHIEAGERSRNRRMPEEINRVMSDHLSDVFFCVSAKSAHHLAQEGLHNHVYVTGDIMLDCLLSNLELAKRKSTILKQLGLSDQEFSLVTIHRAENTGDAQRMQSIATALNEVAEPIIFPVHPRTQSALAANDIKFGSHVRLIEPVGYFDMMMLESHARLIATDSGGVQREAYYLAKPCLTLREETEWTETVDAGWNQLVGADTEKIVSAWMTFAPPAEHPPILGDGSASQRIVQTLDAIYGMQEQN